MKRALTLITALVLGGTLPARGQEISTPSANVHCRGSLNNCRLKFLREKKGHVAFIGGSITEMNGYRPLVCDLLRRRFPETQFTFTDAGIASTCSTTGAFRLQTDVLCQAPVDLFFIEFAVNDDQDAHHSREACIRGLEGIVRQSLRSNPQMDMVITYFVNPEMLETLQSGKTPLTMAAHEEVAVHYSVSTIHLAKEVAEQITAGRLTWQVFGGTHPAPAGNALCAGMIDELLGRAWNKPLADQVRPVAHPQVAPLDKLCYENGRFVDPKQARLVRGWELEVPAWKTLKGSTRGRFTQIPMLCAEQPGAELVLEFEGTVVGAYIVAGPDAGLAEARVDGGPPVEVDLYHRFSAGLHYPRTVMFAADLKPGPHTLTLRLADKTQSAGHAMRIMQFVAN
jgi:lysophospholipase L1-like esterase